MTLVQQEISVPRANVFSSRIFVLLAALAAGVFAPVGAAEAPGPQDVNFASGSLIIPMDVGYQNAGMLKAFGLVDKLLRAGVPVSWCILPGKSLYLGTTQFPATPGNSIDFTASATDFKTSAVITAHGYRGGPFVIASTDAAAASPIIMAWQTSNPTAVVHVATQAFTAPVRLVLTASPRIAVLADGNETILFNYLNAAGIPDESNLAWTGTSVDLLTPAQVAGPSTSNPADGALFSSSGLPKFCALATGHWLKTSLDIPNVVPEIQSFLQFPVHVFAECQSVLAIEGEPPTGGQGKLLTSAGLTARAQPSTVQFSSVDQPFAQLDGVFGTVGGSEPAFGLATGSTYDDSSAVMVRSSTAGSVGLDDIWIGGYYNGTCPLSSLGTCTNPGPKGKVTYLGGHVYATATPITASFTTQGVRLFLNSIFAGSCTHAEGQPVISITAAAPATTTSATVTFTLSYSNSGPGPGLGIQLADTLPANTSFVSATGGGTFSAGTVTWNLGDLASGASGSVSVTVNLSTFGTYTNHATASFAIGLTGKTATSNSTQTVYSAQATPPTVVTGVASGISARGATLNGTANPNGTSTNANFEYGQTAGYGSTTPTQAMGSGNVAVAIGGGSLSGLTCNTLYHFRAVATNTGGTTNGSDATFTTPACSGFTDDPLIAGTTPIRAVHVTELRSRIDALRLFFGPAAFAWTDPSLSGIVVKTVHVAELRAALRDAYDAAIAAGRNVTRPSFTDDPLTPQQTMIQAIHVAELRAAVLTLEAQE